MLGSRRPARPGGRRAGPSRRPARVRRLHAASPCPCGLFFFGPGPGAAGGSPRCRLAGRALARGGRRGLRERPREPCAFRGGRLLLGSLLLPASPAPLPALALGLLGRRPACAAAARVLPTRGARRGAGAGPRSLLGVLPDDQAFGALRPRAHRRLSGAGRSRGLRSFLMLVLARAPAARPGGGGACGLPAPRPPARRRRHRPRREPSPGGASIEAEPVATGASIDPRADANRHRREPAGAARRIGRAHLPSCVRPCPSSSRRSKVSAIPLPPICQPAQGDLSGCESSRSPDASRPISPAATAGEGGKPGMPVWRCEGVAPPGVGRGRRPAG